MSETTTTRYGVADEYAVKIYCKSLAVTSRPLGCVNTLVEGRDIRSLLALYCLPVYELHIALPFTTVSV